MKEEIRDLKAELFDLQLQLNTLQTLIREKVLKLNQLLKDDKSDTSVS